MQFIFVVANYLKNYESTINTSIIYIVIYRNRTYIAVEEKTKK